MSVISLSGYAIIQLPEIAIYFSKNYKDCVPIKSIERDKSHMMIQIGKSFNKSNEHVLTDTQNKQINEKRKKTAFLKINDLESQLEKMSEEIKNLRKALSKVD